MAKKITSNPKTETAARIQRTEAYANQVRALFAMTVNQILALNKSVPKLEPGVMFSFDAQSLKMQKEVERLLRQLHSVATMAIQNGIKLEWGQANAAADQLVKSVIGKDLMSNPTFNAWTARNGAAMQKFINRSEKGLNLSGRVWKSVKQLRDEMEVAITVAVGDGKSAQKMSQDVRKYLNDPDLMFRRFRYKKGEEIEYDDEGNEIGKKIIWGKKWKKRVKKPDGSYGWIDYDKNTYKDDFTGKGYYKSSTQNAMRVARTETNIAYRRADNERWNQMDFVLGQRINLSRNHPAKDICDKLAGDYPKEFLFDGWHPQCFCYVTPITLPPEETAHLTDMMLNGEDWRAELARLKKGREITQYPDNFKTWVVENKNKILNAHDNGTDPYFIRNNFKAINAILNPDSKDAQELLQKEEQQRIEQAQHQAELEAKQKETHITQISAKYGDKVLNIMKSIPGIDTTALQAAIKAGDPNLIQEEANKLRNIGKQFKLDAKRLIDESAQYWDIPSHDLESAITAGNIKDIWQQTKELQKQVDKIKYEEDNSTLKTLIDNASKIITYNEVKRLKTPLSENDIIDKVGGGDLTNGSCSSVALTYAANKCGFDVRDFRGGESENYFASSMRMMELADKTGGVMVRHTDDFTKAHELFIHVAEGKEYYFAVAQHAAIIRKTSIGFEYLELQDPDNNGWYPLNDRELKLRFVAKKQNKDKWLGIYETKACLIDIELLKKNPGFRKLLGYINTNEAEQKKGKSGTTK